MKKIELNISKSFIINIIVSLLLTLITIIIIFQTNNYYIDRNPLSQFGPVYTDESIDAYYELSNARDFISDWPYPNDFEILLIQLKIIFAGRYDVTISYLTFFIYLVLIYAIKYLKVKIV
jgi:hypothetical protein